jgi:hypothetical protein
MSKPTDYFPADDLDAPPTTAGRSGIAGYIPPEKMFSQGCPKCRGTGQFRSYSGRALGPCYACKGAGKLSFKTSPETRAKAKISRAESFGRKLENFLVEHQDITDWFVRVIDQRPQNPFRFAVSLRDACAKYGSLTDNQVAAARKCIAQDAERDAQREADRAARQALAPVADVSKLDEAFAIARQRAERTGQMGVFVKPLLLKSGEVSISVSPGKPGGKWDGMLFVRDATNDERKLGFFKEGRYYATREASPTEQAAVLEAACDPFQAVKAYAKAWSRCGVCGQQLLNDVSIEAGMGPVCRSKFGW